MADQTITFGVIGDAGFGDADFGISATASSGLDVSLAATGPCSLDAATSPANVHITAAGTCQITASQAGDANWNAATDVVRDFDIAKASQSITFGTLTDKTYGDADFDVSASASSSLDVSFGASGNCSMADADTVHITGAGSCQITASQAGDDNFNPASDVSHSFNIAKATASVGLSGLNPTYDGSPHAAGVSTTPSGLTVDVTYDGSATAPTDAGSYAVHAVVNDANYQGSADDTLVIAKATATIQLSNLSQTFDSNPHYASSSTTPSGLTVVITYKQGSTPVTDPTAVGSYDVHAVIDDANYQGSADDTLTITAAVKQSQSITFAALSGKTFGNADFDVSATASSGLAVTFGASGNCSMADADTVHLTGAGSCTITASQAGDDDYNAAPDVARVFSIAKASTSTGISTSGSPSRFGQAVTFTATVSSGAGTPVGSVQFKLDGANVGSPVALTGGQAQWVTSSLSVHLHKVSATYVGNADFNGSASSLLNQQVKKSKTGTSLVVSPNPAGRHASVTFTATVVAVAPGAGTPVGKVRFMVNGHQYGALQTVTAGTSSWTFTWSLPAGTYKVRAVFVQGSGYKTSHSTVVTLTIH